MRDAKCTIGTMFCTSGRFNEMDFQLVADLGMIAATHPGSQIVVFSKDNGYDAVITSMRRQGHNIVQIKSVYQYKRLISESLSLKNRRISSASIHDKTHAKVPIQVTKNRNAGAISFFNYQKGELKENGVKQSTQKGTVLKPSNKNKNEWVSIDDDSEMRRKVIGIVMESVREKSDIKTEEISMQKQLPVNGPFGWLETDAFLDAEKEGKYDEEMRDLGYYTEKDVGSEEKNNETEDKEPSIDVTERETERTEICEETSEVFQVTMSNVDGTSSMDDAYDNGRGEKDKGDSGRSNRFRKVLNIKTF